MAKKKTVLQRTRELMGFSSRRVAEAIKMDVSGFVRIESGEVQPTRKTANKIHSFYDGLVPLGVIYDPSAASSTEWYGKVEVPKIIELGKRLARKHPQLARSDRRRNGVD